MGPIELAGAGVDGAGVDGAGWGWLGCWAGWVQLGWPGMGCIGPRIRGGKGEVDNVTDAKSP